MHEVHRNACRKHALINAVEHSGKASWKAVIGKLIAEFPDLKKSVKSIMEEVKKIVDEINEMNIEEMKEVLEMEYGYVGKEKKKKEMKLPPLENADKNVVMRFAPGPSGPLHIGHTRAAILNDEYVKMYNGKFVLRFEDTAPKRVNIDAYKMIEEDLTSLEVKVHERIVQSDRFEIYYDFMRKLIHDGHAYVCTCNADDWRKMKMKMIPCPHRDSSIEDNIERWEEMLEGRFGEGEAVAVVKTNIKHRNPAIRDFVGMRIDTTPHPLKGDRYIVYPLMNFAVAIDDHLLGLTHVLRGKDHLNNTYRQEYIFKFFGWRMPKYIHYGRVKIEGPVLKTSLMLEGIKNGLYRGWDDVRLGTVRALLRRGIKPQAIRRYWINVGTKDVDIVFSWENLYSYNKEIIDDSANRYFFVREPKRLDIDGVDKLISHAPLHPNHPERGKRKTIIERDVYVYVSEEDMPKKDEMIRLKDMCNLIMKDGRAEYAGNDLSVVKRGVKIIHWVPPMSLKAKVLMPSGEIIEGLAEMSIRNEVENIIQLERFGFVRVECINDEVSMVFCHG